MDNIDGTPPSIPSTTAISFCHPQYLRSDVFTITDYNGTYPVQAFSGPAGGGLIKTRTLYLGGGTYLLTLNPGSEAPQTGVVVYYSFV